MVRWPGVTKGGHADKDHVIGTVDILPTILDILGIKEPKGLDGRSFKSILQGKKQDNRDIVYVMYEENVGGNRQPTRGVVGKKYGYIVNLWSDGERKFATATKGMASTSEMFRLAEEGDKYNQKRSDLFTFRVPEEFFDYEKDPDALIDLIKNPEYKKLISQYRKKAIELMQKSNDPILDIYKDRNDKAAVQKYLAGLDEESQARKQDARYSRSGKAKASKKGKKTDQDRAAKRKKKREKNK
jgi:N-sulfoglucosamine sulfohydrolase